ncbi:uncharacterized protein LOC110047727, partial [Orbicella faveolata]|uniref:uncharacterized protein LOC110047727 n=1 Tax=Orbicella faveolata TaxID=48498 RepID=UPI0009E53FAC
FISGVCTKFFFNSTSQTQVPLQVIPLRSGFDFSFRTCSGGVLLDQKGQAMKGVQTKLPLERSSASTFPGDSLEAEQDFKFYVVAVQPKKHTGPSNGFVRLEVVPTTAVKYSVTPVLLIASHLKMTWSINSIEESVTLGKDLDQNIICKVQFTAG